MKIVYDVINKKVVSDRPNGMLGFMSLERFATQLVSEGEITPSEKLTHLEFTEGGIYYRTEKK